MAAIDAEGRFGLAGAGPRGRHAVRPYRPWKDVDPQAQRARKLAALDEALDATGAFDRTGHPACRWAAASSPHELNRLDLCPFGSTDLFDLGFPNPDGPGVVSVRSCSQFPAKAAGLFDALYEALRYLEHRGRLTLERVRVRYSAETGDYEIALWRRPGHFPPLVGQVLSQRTGATSVVLVPFDGDAADPRPRRIEVLDGAGVWCETVGDEAFVVSATSQFPESTQAAQDALECALGMLALSGAERVGVFGAGVGLYAVPVSRAAAHVACYQPEGPDLADFQRNRMLAPEGVIDVVSRLDEEGESAVTHGDAAVCGGDSRPSPFAGPFDAAFVDADAVRPDDELIRAVLRGRPSRIVVACSDAACLAVVAGALCLEGGYGITRAEAVDVVPDSDHAIYLAKFE